MYYRKRNIYRESGEREREREREGEKLALLNNWQFCNI